MGDEKKSKGRGSSGKTGSGKTKSDTADVKKKIALENSGDVTGKVVSLSDEKIARKKEIEGKIKEKKKAAKAAQNESVTVNSQENNMEKKMSKATANTANPFDKFSTDAMSFSKDCSEACAKSGQIFMKGFEDIFGAVVTLVQSSAEKNAKFVKEAMSSKTINEFAEVQSKIAQASFDDFMTGATKLSELSVKVISEGSEPVNAQITKAVQKATETMAA